MRTACAGGPRGRRGLRFPPRQVALHAWSAHRQLLFGIVPSTHLRSTTDAAELFDELFLECILRRSTYRSFFPSVSTPLGEHAMRMVMVLDVAQAPFAAPFSTSN